MHAHAVGDDKHRVYCSVTRTYAEMDTPRSIPSINLTASSVILLLWKKRRGFPPPPGACYMGCIVIADLLTTEFVVIARLIQVIEESPSCLVTPEVRFAMQEQAVMLSKATGYR